MTGLIKDGVVVKASSEPAKKQPLSLKDLQPRDALRYAIGEYFEIFGSVEMFVSVAMHHVSGLPLEKIHFIWRDTFVAQKVNTLRRIAKEKFGASGRRWLSLKSILSDIEDLLPFRNDLAHGAFISTDEGIKFGKAGQSWAEVFQGFDKIKYEDIQAKTKELNETTKKLSLWIVTP